VTFNGSLTASGDVGDFCGTLPSPLHVSTDNFTVVEVGSAGSLSATFTDFDAVVNLTGSDPLCIYNDVEMLLTGNLAVVTKNGVGVTLTSTQAQFNLGSSIDIFTFQYGPECVPVQYLMSVDGDIALLTDGALFDATYDQYLISNDATAGDNHSVDGPSVQLSSGRVTLAREGDRARRGCRLSERRGAGHLAAVGRRHPLPANNVGMTSATTTSSTSPTKPARLCTSARGHRRLTELRNAIDFEDVADVAVAEYVADQDHGAIAAARLTRRQRLAARRLQHLS
jgi:hypothetical protein